MRISLKLDYANRAVLQLTKSYDGKRVLKLDDVSKKECIPAAFLVQILTDLKKSGIVMSKRGKDGGYRLARSPSRISLADVIASVEPQLLEQHAGIQGESAIILDPVWRDLSESFRSKAKSITFDKLINQSNEPMWFI